MEPLNDSLRQRMAELQQILAHSLNDPRLLVEALTHPSHASRPTYERLEHVGDAALNLAFTNFLYYNNPALPPGRLSVLRSANISTEKLARVAARHGFYNYLRRVSPVQDQMVEDFTRFVMAEDATDIACAAFGGANVKAPKILADLVESIAGAVYVDSNYDLKLLWKVFKPLMQPIIESENLQPITKVYELCQKMGKNIEFVDSVEVDPVGNKTHVVKAVIGGVTISQSKSDQKTIAKLNAARLALQHMQRRNPRKAPATNNCGGSEQKEISKLNVGGQVPSYLQKRKAPDITGSEQNSTTKLDLVEEVLPHTENRNTLLKAPPTAEYSRGSEQSAVKKLDAAREVLSDMENRNTLPCGGSDESGLSIKSKEAQNEVIKRRCTAQLLPKRAIYDVCPAAAMQDRVGAKQELHRMCGKNHWGLPVYKLHREEGPAHDKSFVASVLVQTPDTNYIMLSGLKQKLKEAENQAAFGLLLKFQNLQKLGTSGVSS